MAYEGTPTKCTFKDCPAKITLSQLTTGHILTSYEFSCEVHGFLGWFAPSHTQTPVGETFTFAELTELLKFARIGQRETCPNCSDDLIPTKTDTPVVEKLARRLTAAMIPDFPTERPNSDNPGIDPKTR